MAPLATVGLPVSSIDAITQAAPIAIGLAVISFIAVSAYARSLSRRCKRLQLELSLCQNEFNACQTKVTRLEAAKKRRAGRNAELGRRNGKLKELIGGLRYSNEVLTERLKGVIGRQRELICEKDEANDRLRKLEDSLYAWSSPAEPIHVMEVGKRLREARDECRQSKVVIETLQLEKNDLLELTDSYQAQIWELKDKVAEYRRQLRCGQPCISLKVDSKPLSSGANSKPGAKFWSAPVPDLLHKF